MCRKLIFLIVLIYLLVPLNSPLFGAVEMKVDLASPTYPIKTAKPGWNIWSESAWANQDRHDPQVIDNIGGSGIGAVIGTYYGQEGALIRSLEEGGEDVEPICNTFFRHYEAAKGSSVALLLFGTGPDYKLSPGTYTLKSYHRDPAGRPHMARIEAKVNDVTDPRYANRAPIGVGNVTQIPTGEGNDVNVGIPGDPIQDACLPNSLVMFVTDGTPVLIKYVGGSDCAVVNAFILEVPEPNTAFGPSPGHESDFVCPDANLTWEAGRYAADTNGHNLYFGTDLSEEFAIFEDSFEAGLDANWTASNWTQYDANEDPNSHWGRYSATAGGGAGTLTSDAIDASEAGSLRVELWIRTLEGVEAGDIDLYYYDGNNWDFIADLNSVAENNRWRRFTHETTDSQYLVSTFKLELRSNISAGEVFIDDVSVHNTWPLNAQWFVGNQDGLTYDPPGLLDFNTTYYWRVDEVNSSHPDQVWKGNLWSFTTETGKARDPSPQDKAGSRPVEGITLSWTPSCLATSGDYLYLSTDFDDVNNGDPSVRFGPLLTPSHDTGALEFAKRYYWKVNGIGAVTLPEGDIWTFQTTGYPLMHYTFDGVHDDNVPDPITDSTGNVTFEYGPGYGTGGDIKYAAPNPIFNAGGTSAAFHYTTDSGHAFLWREAVGDDILDLASPAYTIEAWFKLDSFGNLIDEDDFASTIIRRYESSYILAIGEDGAVRFVHSGDDVTESAPELVELGQWYHVAAVFDSQVADANEIEKLYLNGVVVADNNVPDLNPTSDDEPVTIGGRTNPFGEGGGRYLRNAIDGYIDELRVVDLALTPDDFLIRGDANLAWLPRPYNYAKDVQYDTDLKWEPGEQASSHDVYLGTNWDEVNDANSSIHPNVDYNHVDVNMEDIPYLLDLDQTYYWRVDEINDTSSQTWKGYIWRFTVAEYIIIDDMEAYTLTTEYPITKQGSPADWGWDDMYVYVTGAILGLITPTENTWLPYHGGDQAMLFSYDNSIYGWYYSEARTHFEVDPDWTFGGVRMLSLWFYGQQLNMVTDAEQMYVGLDDSDSDYAEVRYPLEDINDIQVEEWQQWNIPLSEFESDNSAVDLNSVKTFYIGFGDRDYTENSGSTGNVAFDDIRVYPPTCVPSIRQPDLDWNNDCIVDWGEIEIMAEDWLIADVNLGQVTEPCDANLVGWWKFDEGDGSTASDSSSYNNPGTLEILDVNVSWIVGRDGNALDFDGGRVRVPDAPELKPLHEVSVSVWIKCFDDQDETARVLAKGADDKETYVLKVSDNDELRFAVCDGNDYDPCDDEYEQYEAETDDDAIDYDEWIHVAGTFDGNSVKCYMNAELAAQNDDANALVFLSQDTNDLAIGSRPDEDNRAFEGIIDDVRIYDYGLSQAEVAWLATDGTGILEVQSIANLVNDEQLGDRAVNLRDLAILADDWLVQELYP